MPEIQSLPIGRREALRRAALTFGAALSAPTIAAVLGGCEARPAGAHWHARALDDAQADLLGAVVDHIIPPTDTPGARGAGVPQFIDLLLAEYYTPDERQRFVAGLGDIDARARRTCGRTFLRCAPHEQRALLEAIDRETFAPRPPSTTAAAARGGGANAGNAARDVSRETEHGGGGGPSDAGGGTTQPSSSTPRAAAPPPFFRTLKELTITGYYTSKIGATTELHYVPVPGRYDGCVPLARIGRTWAV